MNLDDPIPLPTVVVFHNDPVVQNFVMRLAREVTNGMFYVLAAYSKEEAVKFCENYSSDLAFAFLDDPQIAQKIWQVAPQAKVLLLVADKKGLKVQTNGHVYEHETEFSYAVRRAWRILKDLVQQEEGLWQNAKSTA